MTWYYTHRSEWGSTLIKEASACSRWQSGQRVTDGHCAKTLELSTLNKRSLSNLPLKTQGSVGKKRQNCMRQGWWMTPRKESSRHTRTDEHTEIVTTSRRPAQLQIGNNLSTEKGSGYQIRPLIMKQISIDSS